MRLSALAALTLLLGAAMLPAMATMADHGASVIAFESAGSVARSQEIVDEWGPAGRGAMWWQLAIDTPFLVAYGLFLACACAAVRRRAEERRMPRLARAASVTIWLGPLAAAADLLQNVSLAIVLAAGAAQPWPRIAAIAGPVTTACALAAILFAIGGRLATRRVARVGPAALRRRTLP